METELRMEERLVMFLQLLMTILMGVAQLVSKSWDGIVRELKMI